MNENVSCCGVRWRSVTRATLAFYWLAMFAGTHWPRFHLAGYPRGFDKVLHFLAYSGLSFLIGVWLSTKREVSRRDLAGIFALLVAYSIFDELTQIPVGRSCDFFDAVADCIGGLIGLGAFLLVRSAVRRIAAAQRLSA